MFGQVLVAAGFVVFVLAVLLLTVVLGMRGKSSPILGLVRQISRAINPMQMRSAGSPGAYASVIRYRGRRSGRAYATPVGAVRVGDGFVITLPYGTRAQWVRNVLAAGSATLVNEGETFAVDDPEIVTTSSVQSCFSPADQRIYRFLRFDECLRVRRTTRPAEQSAAEADLAGAADRRTAVAGRSALEVTSPRGA